MCLDLVPYKLGKSGLALYPILICLSRKSPRLDLAVALFTPDRVSARCGLHEEIDSVTVLLISAHSRSRQGSSIFVVNAVTAPDRIITLQILWSDGL